ncbi:uncharacterized protein LOC126746595 [Anthonomus grandis grandis]|uniref:uncharacterized protein LOC126746595 n=1 Tax=Anthonomus grandis grandis TaxID=2921223 RepID=UPI0021662408|nr:uncharacterized protein LOC126746595 [Anthonomus grandis grandis]
MRVGNKPPPGFRGPSPEGGSRGTSPLVVSLSGGTVTLSSVRGLSNLQPGSNAGGSIATGRATHAVYAPTCSALDDEIERFYDDISQALTIETAHYKYNIGDFNAKLGVPAGNGNQYVGKFGLGCTNERGERLINYLQKETDSKDLMDIVENFYSTLYTGVNPEQAIGVDETILNVGSEDLPDITREEVELALSQKKNGKAPGEDGIIAKMIKLGGRTTVEAMTILLNKCMTEGVIPQAWQKAQVVSPCTISPKLFTLALEDVFKTLDWNERGIKIDGKHLSHLRFADDIVLFSQNIIELQDMLAELQRESKRIGLTMNLNKTKVMSPDNIQVHIEDRIIDNVEEYVYLGHCIKLGKENQTAEINRRVRLTWAATGKLSHVLRNETIPINLKRKVFNACLLPVMTYGMETMTLTVKSANKLRTTQRAIERMMLGISLRDHITNESIRQRTLKLKTS